MPSARQRQIIEAAVRVIAREGVESMSFMKVVHEAQLSSSRLISYHFGTREELLRRAFAHVVEQAGEFMSPRIAEHTSIRGKVRVYITSNLRFLAQQPDYAKAALALARTFEQPAADTGLALLEHGFRAGQASGELRMFDPRAVAVALRGAIDATVADLVTNRADPDVAIEILSDLFDRAIRATTDAES